MATSQNDNSGARLDASDSRAGGSESARRVLELLLSFSREQHTQTTRQLAEATGIPLPTTYRYVGFLRSMGLLVERGNNGYSLSARIVGLAQAAEAAESLIDIAHPVMQRLSDEVGETVILVRLIGGAAVCVHRIESQQHLRISFEPGQPLPAQRGASGRLLLASLSPGELRRRLDDVAAEDPERARQLAADVALAAERRWATSTQEIDRGVWAAAAAIVDHGRIVASLSVPSPLMRAPAEQQEELLQRVRDAAAEINTALTRAASGRG
jgi:DNA-binding IclR family transcriptional regulator